MITTKLHSLFEESAKRFPDRTAVVFGDQTVTYSELEKRSSDLANSILELASDEGIIAISATRSIEMITGLLAILKAGKAYMPIDPEYPQERTSYMVGIAGVKVIIAMEDEEKVWNALNLRRIDPFDFKKGQNTSKFPDSSLATVLFTSGSTGKPKGVKLNHTGLFEFLQHQLKSPKERFATKALQFCHLGFDVSISEIFTTLGSGGELHLIGELQRLDSLHLLEYVEKHGINRLFFPFVALQYFTNTAVERGIFPNQILEITTGGELLKVTPSIREFFKHLPNATLKNIYGPTEASIWVTEVQLEGDSFDWPEIPPIGSPVADCDLYVLDEQLRQVDLHQKGELYLAGNCLADGYINREDLTNERFIYWQSPHKGRIRLYRTGDLVSKGERQIFYFHGRQDDQIKIRGNRVELGEIEIALGKIEKIKQAVVRLEEDESNMKYLSAYVQYSEESSASVANLKEKLKSSLPDYMIPDYITVVEGFPKTSSGKIDRKALPKPANQRPEWAPQIVNPSNNVETNIASVFKEILNYTEISVHDNFFELGGNSLRAQRTISELRNRFDYKVAIVKLYQFPTVSQMAGFVADKIEPKLGISSTFQTANSNSGAKRDVAIIGIAMKFPGADSEEELLDILRNGKETISFFGSEEIDRSVAREAAQNPDFVAARGIIEDFDKFDSSFFGFNTKLASITDPQQRKFLEVSYEVLEKTGYRAKEESAGIGVFAGCSNNTYFTHNLIGHKDILASFAGFQVSSLNEKDYIASRTAYHLNLTGPAVSVHSACSTSLLAVAQAVDAIRTGKCSMAIAGGASIHSPVYSGHIFEEGSVYSKDGHVNSFDASASGTVFSDGVGVVLLKELEQAQKDGDRILAIVKGIGINNDGSNKGSFSAPSAEGQAGAITQAIADAGILPKQIGYIEAHATATPIGDPIEIEGLQLAFGDSPDKQYCALGTIKSNLGHLNAASGIAGLIRAILTLHHKEFFPQRGFAKANPAIDLESSPFRILVESEKWATESSRIAGVSSFGVGGTNVHLILEESPLVETTETIVDDESPAYLINLSAKSKESLEAYAAKLLRFVNNNSGTRLSDIAYNLQLNRPNYNLRRSIPVRNLAELSVKLKQFSGEPTKLGKVGELVFLFPGQGAQYLNMGRELYGNFKVFKDSVDECAAILDKWMDIPLLDVIFPKEATEAKDAILRNTKYTQPAIFTIELALAKLWISLGSKPMVLCGHSIGEFVAAHISGVFKLEDALRIVSTRGRLIAGLPEGSMMSVGCSEDELKGILPKELSVAGLNGTSQCVVAGETDKVAQFEIRLSGMDIPAKILRTSHAFHSHMMDPILLDFADLLRTIDFGRPRIPIVSTVTGQLLTDSQAQSVDYWTRQLRNPVRFSDALDTILGLSEKSTLLEVGPGTVLSSLARQHPNLPGTNILPSIVNKGGDDEYRFFLQSVGKLWESGHWIDWGKMYKGTVQTVDLPTYAFRKERAWLDPFVGDSIREASSIKTTPSAVVDRDLHQESKRGTLDSQVGIRDRVARVVEISTGISATDGSMAFFDLGFDSLILTQLAVVLKKEFGVPITFRMLSESLLDLDSVVKYLEDNLPKTNNGEQAGNVGVTTDFENLNKKIAPSCLAPTEQEPALDSNYKRVIEHLAILSRQIQLLSGQVELLSGGNGVGNGSVDSGNSGRDGGSKNEVIETKVRLHQELPDILEIGKNNFSSANKTNDSGSKPPIPGAKLGKDKDGNPAWYIKDEANPGKFLKLLIEV